MLIKIFKLPVTVYISEIMFQIVLNILVFLLLAAKKQSQNYVSSSTSPEEACLS